MNQKAIDVQLPATLCSLIGQLTNYPFESLETIDRYNNLRVLIIQIDEGHFNQNLFGVKELTWEQAIKEVEVYLEDFDIFDGLAIDESADLEHPSLPVVVNLLSQILAIHWLCSEKIDEALEKVEPAERECFVRNIEPFRAILAEAIARECVAHKQQNRGQTTVTDSRTSLADRRRSSEHRGSSSLINQRLQTKVNARDKQLEAEAFRIRKMEEYIESLRSDINNACAKNDELESNISHLRVENQSVKTDIRYQKNRIVELNIALDQEKAEKEKAFEQLALAGRTIAKMQQEQAVYSQSQAELTEMLAMKGRYKQYMDERENFLKANNEISKEKLEVVKQLRESRELMDGLKVSFQEQSEKLKAAIDKQMKLEMENLLLARENQQLKVENASLTRLFDNETLNKRKQGEGRSSSRSPAAPQPTGRSEEVEQLRMQLARMKADNVQLRQENQGQKRALESQIESSNSKVEEVQRELQEARAQLERLDFESASQGVPVAAQPSPPVDSCEREVQVGPELLEMREIDSNYIVYSAVMDFMTTHMQLFRETESMRIPRSNINRLFISNVLKGNNL